MKQSHLFIIWQSGFKHLPRIFWELSQNFDIKYAEKIIWDKEEIVKNLKKIYPNRNFNNSSPKIKEIGGNELFFTLVVDKNPNISNKVNLNISHYKYTHRLPERKYLISRNKAYNYLHASDNIEETFLNYQALTGNTQEQFEELVNNQEKVIYITKRENQSIDIEKIQTSKIKFSKLTDIFNLLNKYTQFVVIRNWENLLTNPVSDNHGDIDILTKDYYKTLTLLQALPVFKDRHRVCHLVKVDKSFIPFDIRYIGDDYYDEKWEEMFFKNRVLENCFYRLNDKDYFWSLLYHALFHKRKIIPEYKKRLKLLGSEIAGFDVRILYNNKLAKKFLKYYLNKHNIKITKPKDKSVILCANSFDEVKLAIYYIKRIVKNSFKRKIDLSDLSKNPSIKNLNLNLKKSLRIKNGVFIIDDVILKIADINHKFLLKNEAKILKQIEHYKYFPNVISFLETEKESYLFLERIKGKDLYRKRGIQTKMRNEFIYHLDRIFAILKKENIIHRDIRPHNLIITKRGFPFLIDFEFAIFNKKEIVTTNDLERYILETCKKTLGGEWRAQNAPLDEIDSISLGIIKKQYCENRIKFSHFLKNYLKLLINGK